MAITQEADQHALDEILLADDMLADVVPDGLETMWVHQRFFMFKCSN